MPPACRCTAVRQWQWPCSISPLVAWQVRTSQGHKFFEHAHRIVGSSYFAYASGPTYALSWAAASMLAGMSPSRLRRYGCGDDCSIGMWLLAFNATYLEDPELCRPNCSSATVSIWHRGRCVYPGHSESQVRPSSGSCHRALLETLAHCDLGPC